MAAALPHLKSITVRNFKRFESLSIEDIGGLNLIVGDNNVGKSSVLEFLLFNEQATLFAHYLKYALFEYRNFKNTLDSFIYQYANKTGHDHSKITFDLNFENGNHEVYVIDLISGELIKKGLDKRLTDSSITGNGNNYAIGIETPPYLPFQLSYNHDFAVFYSKNIQLNKSKKNRLIADMKALIPDIDNIEPSPAIVRDQSVIIIGQQGKDSNMPLGTFGDGAIKLFRILIEMQIHTGSRLMIDEVDTGIHYSRLKIFWTTLIRAAKANNVQLFVTTHNEECIKYFKEALSDEGEATQNESRIIRLAEMKDKQVRAFTYKYADFVHSIENDNELR